MVVVADGHRDSGVEGWGDCVEGVCCVIVGSVLALFRVVSTSLT